MLYNLAYFSPILIHSLYTLQKSNYYVTAMQKVILSRDLSERAETELLVFMFYYLLAVTR